MQRRVSKTQEGLFYSNYESLIRFQNTKKDFKIQTRFLKHKPFGKLLTWGQDYRSSGRSNTPTQWVRKVPSCRKVDLIPSLCGRWPATGFARSRNQRRCGTTFDTFLADRNVGGVLHSTLNFSRTEVCRVSEPDPRWGRVSCPTSGREIVVNIFLVFQQQSARSFPPPLVQLTAASPRSLLYRFQALW